MAENDKTLGFEARNVQETKLKCHWTKGNVSSHHQCLVHEILSPRAAIVILRVHGEAQEEDVNHVFKHRQEAMGHQEGKETDDEKRQHPHCVVPLIVQSQNASKSCAGDYKNLRMKTHSQLEKVVLCKCPSGAESTCVRNESKYNCFLFFYSALI